jgi:signal transduction histidine kinase/CheY-like chemotaxis protein
MNKRITIGLYCFSFFAILLLCVLTGGIESPARFLYFPLIVILSQHLDFKTLIGTGILFSLLLTVLIIPHKIPTIQIPVFPVEIFAYIFSAFAAGLCSREKQKERTRYDNAISTFHSLSDALNYKNMNLQTTLDALSAAHSKLQDYDNNKTKFMSNVSHELRTPLSSIRSYSEILLNYDDIDTDTRIEFIQIINSESERLSALVNEVLDLVRVESGKFELNISPVSPDFLLKESEKIIKPMASDKGLLVVLKNAGEMPDVQGDRNQLLQVLVNLLNNAVKFTNSGTITLGARRNEDFVEFYVTDTGEGIFPDEKDVIFDEFYRISEVLENRPKGSGLGLSISKKIVEYHGGKIWVDSKLGEGSTFYFTIPCSSEKVRSIASHTPLLNKSPCQAYLPILVLSSDITVRRALREKLEELGYQTLGADNPARASQIVSETRPGLIVTDIIEERDDLIELLRWARNSRVQTILVSLHIFAFGEEPRLALSGYLSKPFDKHGVMSLLEEFSGKGGRLALISSDKEESRTLQVLLSSLGYQVKLFSEGAPAVKECIDFPPAAIIVGSFRKNQLEEIIASLKANAQTKNIPIFLIIGMSLHNYVKTVALDKTVQTTGKNGLYKLVGEIESAYTKTQDGI